VTAGVETDVRRASWVLRPADDCLVLGQRLGAQVSRGPDLEEDIAIANLAIDLIGQARALYTHAGALEGAGRDEDALAMERDERAFTNVLLVEQPDVDFAHTILRQLLFAAFQAPFYDALARSSDPTLAGIAQKGVKEARYHLSHSSNWAVRLGDGTEESHRRMTEALAVLWRFTDDLFEADDLDRELAAEGFAVDPSTLRPAWEHLLEPVFDAAGLTPPDDAGSRTGGRQGFHTEHLGHLLPDLQWLHRSHPGAEW
jgi:ring-1,2-phenylacetyl-CoA epoxidase subunit PaaC